MKNSSSNQSLSASGGAGGSASGMNEDQPDYSTALDFSVFATTVKTKRAPIGSRQVDCWTVTGKFVARFDGFASLEKALNVPYGDISSCCRGIKEIANGLYRLRFAGEHGGPPVIYPNLENIVDYEYSTRGPGGRTTRVTGTGADTFSSSEAKNKKKKPWKMTAEQVNQKYYDDINNEIKHRIQTKHIPSRKFVKVVVKPVKGKGTASSSSSSSLVLKKWTPQDQREPTPKLQEIKKFIQPSMAAKGGTKRKKTWRESRGLPPKDAVRLQPVPMDITIINESNYKEKKYI